MSVTPTEFSSPQYGSRLPVVIIGAGISGLSAAYYLHKAGIEFIVLEISGAPGGAIKSVREDGWLLEKGADSIVGGSSLVNEMIEDLGIATEVVPAGRESGDIFILRGGALCKMPATLSEFLRTPLLSIKARFRLLKEPFIPTGPRGESVAQFFTRRFGVEFLNYIIDPLVAGICAGTPEQLSMEHVFPSLYEMEERNGSLVRGMLAGSRTLKNPGNIAPSVNMLQGSISFTEGLETLPSAIAKRLGNAIRYGCTVNNVIPMRAGRFPIFTVRYLHDSVQHTVEAASVIFTSPASSTAGMIRAIDPGTAHTLESIRYPPLVKAYTGYRNDQLPAGMKGLGFFVPRCENRNILALLRPVSKHPNWAPEGHTGLTTYVGGSRQPELAERSYEVLEDIITKEHRNILGITGPPAFFRILKCPNAIPQYIPGYAKILKELQMFEANFRGAFICGSYRGGVSIADRVQDASRIAERAGKHLAQR